MTLWLSAVTGHAGDIALSTLVLMKRPISVVLAMCITAALLQTGLTYALDVVRSDIQSFDVCDFSLISSTSICSKSLMAPTAPVYQADFPALMAIQHRTLSELSANSGASLHLVLNVKHAELAVRDLVIMVKASNLTSRGLLGEVLTEFLLSSRHAARSLQVLSSQIHGTMDRWVPLTC